MHRLGRGQGHKARGKHVAAPGKARVLETSLGGGWVLACHTVRLLLQMKRLRTFQCPPEDEAREVAKIFGLLKVHTPCNVLLEGLGGKELFAGRRNLEEDCSDLASHLVELNPYMKKSSLESALHVMDQENKGLLSKGVLPPGFWAKKEAYALKELLMKCLKKAHNFRHRGMVKSNVGKVVQALLSKSQGSDASHDTPQKDNREGWIQKHGRLLRRRSTESDVRIVVPEAPEDSTETMRKSNSCFAWSAQQQQQQQQCGKGGHGPM